MSRFVLTTALLGLGNLLLSGCGSSTEPKLNTKDTPHDEALGVRELTPWQACALVPGNDTDGAECAVATLPLDHEDATSRDFPVLVKRLPPEDGAETRQLWLLHGGPQSSAVDELFGMSRAWRGMPGLGIYAVDHRGIGGAARLTCSAEAPGSDGGVEITEAEWDGCIDEVSARDDLPHLTTTASAGELAALIDELAQDGTAGFLYGGSYGTYLAHRYLQLRPEQPTGVIIEGIVSPHTPHFTGYDADMEGAGRELMNLCAADASCASHFASHPYETVARVVQSLDEGHCAALGAGRDDVRNFLSVLAFFEPFNTTIPALVTRLERCNADDIAALHRYFEMVGGIFGAGLDVSRAADGGARPFAAGRFGLDPSRGNRGDGDSFLIFWHVSLPELYAEGSRVDTLAAELDTYVMTLGAEHDLARLAPRWPILEPDVYHGRWATYDGPILMMQGGLDPTTTLARARPVGEHFDGPNQHWVEFPHDVHDLVDFTPTTDGVDCATTLMRDFVDAPSAALDRSCLERLRPVDFDGDPSVIEALFGEKNAWAN